MTSIRRWTWVACGVAGAIVIALAATLLVVSTSSADGAPSGLDAPVTIPVEGDLQSVAVTPDGRRVLVLTRAGIVVLDAVTHAVLGTIVIRSGSSGQGDMRFSPAGERVYIRTSEGIEPVDLTTGLFGDMIVAGTGTELPYDIEGISRDGNLLIGMDTDTSPLTLVDLRARSARPVPLPPGTIARGLAFSPDGGRVYAVLDAQSYGDLPLHSIDLTTGAAAPVAGVEQASSLALSPDGTSLHVMAGSQAIVLDPATGAVIRSVDSSAGSGFSSGFVVSPGGRYLYAVSYLDGGLQAIDSESGASVMTVPGVTEEPRSLAVTPDGSRLYVLSKAGLTVVPLTGGT
jgi:DNA-binding beta-propeller fold protein YncE